MISFQKIYGLYGLKHHTTEINGDVTMEMTKSENRASQQIDQGLLTFAKTAQFVRDGFPKLWPINPFIDGNVEHFVGYQNRSKTNKTAICEIRGKYYFCGFRKRWNPSLILKTGIQLFGFFHRKRPILGRYVQLYIVQCWWCDILSKIPIHELLKWNCVFITSGHSHQSPVCRSCTRESKSKADDACEQSSDLCDVTQFFIYSK